MYHQLLHKDGVSQVLADVVVVNNRCHELHALLSKFDAALAVDDDLEQCLESPCFPCDNAPFFDRTGIPSNFF